MVLTRDSRLAMGVRSFVRSVRFRLTIWYVLILALVLAVFGSIVYTSQAQSMVADTRDALRRDATRLAEMYDPVSGGIVLPEPAKVKMGLGPEDVALTLDMNGALQQEMGSIDSANLPDLLAEVMAGQKGAISGSADYENV